MSDERQMLGTGYDYSSSLDYPLPTYVLPDEAEAFLAARPDIDSTLWTELDDSDIQLQYLISASAAIDALPLRGERYEPIWIENGQQKDINDDNYIQVLEFPRFIDGVIVDWDQGVSPKKPPRTGFPYTPSKIKQATVWEAIALVLFGSDVDNSDRQNMKNQGVQSYNIGGAYQESLGKSLYEKRHIRSLQALQLLHPYLDRRPAMT